MSRESESEDITFKFRKVYTEFGDVNTVIDIFVGDEEVVYGARTLSEAIEQFDYEDYEL